MNDEANRSEILRKVVGSILCSSLDNQQILSIASQLAADRDFARVLARALLASMTTFSANDVDEANPQRSSAPSQLTGSYSVDAVMKWISSQGISKRELISRLLKRKILRVSPNTLQSESLREIVGRVLASESPDAIARFVEAFGMETATDQYLEGIEGRRSK